MKKTDRKRKKNSFNFSYAFRSFLGYLEGTSKAENTISSYKSDIGTFQTFLEQSGKTASSGFRGIGKKDLEIYDNYLKQNSFRTNTRRRKIMTIRKWLTFLVKRNKIDRVLTSGLPAPAKIERIPFTVPSDELIKKVKKLPEETELNLRNKLLLLVLAETGCRVSEIGPLCYEEKRTVRCRGKFAREIPVSSDLKDMVLRLKAKRASDSKYVFSGFNKFGTLNSPITSRGVEILVKAYAPRLGIDNLTPRTFRHSAVLYWSRLGETKENILQYLGLKTDYAFRIYDVMLQKNGEGLNPTGEPHPFAK